MTLVRGAPDHTILSEQSFAHYKDVALWRANAAVPANPLWEEALNVDIRGVWGNMWMHGDDSRLRAKIVIDGNEIFNMSIWDMWDRGLGGMAYGGSTFGYTVFNLIAMERSVGMWYNDHWQLYIHENITISIQLGGGVPGGGSGKWQIRYKELV